jgi:hypothetical protein
MKRRCSTVGGASQHLVLLESHCHNAKCEWKSVLDAERKNTEKKVKNRQGNKERVKMKKGRKEQKIYRKEGKR